MYIPPQPYNKLFTAPELLREGIVQAAEEGYAILPSMVAEWGCQELSREMDSKTLILSDNVAKPLNADLPNEVTQLHELAHLPITYQTLPVADFVSKVLHMHSRRLRILYPVFATWSANEAEYQLYRDPSSHISKHRDMADDKVLGATITIKGAARITIHEALGEPNEYKNTKEVARFIVEAGSLMLLRAAGLGSGERAIHSVSGPIDGERRIVNLRQR
jgi:hypothetical protein